eukprot:scaffold80557_cov31-Tisochrysis_lutea.AAC.1
MCSCERVSSASRARTASTSVSSSSYRLATSAPSVEPTRLSSRPSIAPIGSSPPLARAEPTSSCASSGSSSDSVAHSPS